MDPRTYKNETLRKVQIGLDFFRLND
eukprot:UN10566